MIEWVVEKLVALLGPLTTLRQEKRELADNALRSISNALNETYLYYRSVKSNCRSPDTEAQLSRYWAEAAIPIRHIDLHLAEICEYKAEYWVNSENWDNAKVKRVGIGLDDVRKQYREKLGFGPTKHSSGRAPPAA